jgi:hypothetical protein
MTDIQEIDNIEEPQPETEALPPLGIFAQAGPPGMIGQSRLESLDQWGNFRLQAEKVIEEIHGQNFIKVFIYRYNEQFFYGFQIKIGKLVRQKKANINDPPMQSREAAKEAARKQIIRICKTGHAIKKLFNDFTIIQYNQPELF